MVQIVGTSKNFENKNIHTEVEEESMIVRNKTKSYGPSTPPNYTNAKRRKGIPHRAPTGALIMEY